MNRLSEMAADLGSGSSKAAHSVMSQHPWGRFIFPSPIHLQLTSVSSTASWGETRTFPGSEQTPQPLLISLSVSLSSTCLSVFLIFTFLHPFSPFYFSATLEQRNENNCCRKCKLFGLLIIPTYAVWSVPVFFFSSQFALFLARRRQKIEAFQSLEFSQWGRSAAPAAVIVSHNGSSWLTADRQY